MQDLTRKQQRVYDFIRDTLVEAGAPPTRAEIADALGFSSANAAQAHLRTLERKGAITLGARRSRGIQLIDDDAMNNDDDASLPVIGRVAAGSPIQAIEHVERRVRVDASVFSAPADYLLTVRGDSMVGAGILDGDLLGVRATTDIRPGQIAVFRWDEEVTVKRFFRDGDTVRLQAENPDFPDIRIDPERETLDIEGLAVGVIRAF